MAGNLISEKEDFVFETTLSGRQPLDLMRRARDAEYTVRLILVVLRYADLHIDRVAQRVSSGGHDIPVPIILRRYESALARLPTALQLADETVIVDHTSRKPAVLLRIAAGVVIESLLQIEEPMHARLACAVAGGLGLDERSVFRR